MAAADRVAAIRSSRVIASDGTTEGQLSRLRETARGPGQGGHGEDHAAEPKEERPRVGREGLVEMAPQFRRLLSKLATEGAMSC